MLKDTSYFKTQIEQPDLRFTHEDFLTISKSIKLKKIPADTCPVVYGDKKRALRLVVKGELRVFGRNEQMRDWFWAVSIYNALRQWKQT